MIALDSETTGLDLHHGAKPFLITVCNEEGENEWWEFDVDPLTREPIVDCDIASELTKTLEGQELVLQNPKFDVVGLELLGFKGWDWENTYDTLYAGHLLNSSQPHDLTTMVLVYLGINVKPYEDKIKEAVKEAYKVLGKKHRETWRLAKKGLPDMPSVKKNTWKNDMWVPRAVCTNLPELLPETDQWNPGDDVGMHPWQTLCADYANSDSYTTLKLFHEQERLLREQDLWEIYLERLKLLPIVYSMESKGITCNAERLDELETEYRALTEQQGKACVAIAAEYDYELTLPKSGNNNSLTGFVFDTLKLPVVKRTKKLKAPAFDGDVLDEYIATLPEDSNKFTFVKTLRAKRKLDTSLSYAESYRRFWLPENSGGNVWHRLYPSLNPTGTATLRWSSSNPNEQNISKIKDEHGRNIRYAFGPKPGREWWSLDYDNLELRIPAYECSEPAMLELFEHPNKGPYYGSYHLLVFDILHPDKFSKHGSDVKNVYKDTWYQWTKNGNFAELYGAVEKSGTADRAFHVKGAQRKVASRLTEKSKLNKQWIAYAEEHGYVETMPDRSVDCSRGYPLYCNRTRYGKIKPTLPLNYHVQGTACWVMMKAMIKVQEYLDTLKGYNMVMNVHDELVFDFPYKPNRGNMSKIRTIRRLMESCGDDIGEIGRAHV